MQRNTTIGIVGCAGDLGSAIAAQALGRGFEVFGTDICDDVPFNVTHADQWKSHVGELIFPRVDTIDGLFRVSDTIHWCAPIDTIDEVPIELTDGLLLLHDSVMTNSLRAKEIVRQNNYRNVGIVHFYMNGHRRVVVASESDAIQHVTQHISELGLDPLIMSVKEHDKNMAHSQAPFAVLHEMLSVELARLASLGLLTPSGEALSAALIDRSAKWTEATLKTLMSNPELPKLLEDMLAMLRVKNGSH